MRKYKESRKWIDGRSLYFSASISDFVRRFQCLWLCDGLALILSVQSLSVSDGYVLPCPESWACVVQHLAISKFSFYNGQQGF